MCDRPSEAQPFDRGDVQAERANQAEALSIRKDIRIAELEAQLAAHARAGCPAAAEEHRSAEARPGPDDAWFRAEWAKAQADLLDDAREAIIGLIWTIERNALWPTEPLYIGLIRASVASAKETLGRLGPRRERAKGEPSCEKPGLETTQSSPSRSPSSSSAPSPSGSAGPEHTCGGPTPDERAGCAACEEEAVPNACEVCDPRGQADPNWFGESECPRCGRSLTSPSSGVDVNEAREALARLHTLARGHGSNIAANRDWETVDDALDAFEAGQRGGTDGR